MADFIDLNPLKGKKENADARQYVEDNNVPDNEVISHGEWNTLVDAVEQLQHETDSIGRDMVKEIHQNNKVYPSENNIITLPSSETIVSLFTDVDEAEPIVCIDGNVKVNICAISTQNGSPTYETVKVDVYTADIGSTLFTRKGTFNMNTQGSISRYESIDITEWLDNGAQQVRFAATGQLTGVSGYLLFNSITLSNLSLEFAVDVSKAQQGSIKLAYYIGGAIHKQIYVKIDGYMVVNGMNVGTQVYNQVAFTEGLEITDERVCTHGVHTIEAWLAASSDSTKKTQSTVNEVFFLADEHDEKPYLVVNNLTTNAQPYVECELFEFCLFSNVKQNVPFVVRGVSADGETRYLNLDMGSVVVGAKLTCINSFDVEDSEPVIPIYLNFYTTNADGEEVMFTGHETASLITLDNSNNFAPTAMQSSGFKFSPKLRSNDEDNPQTVVNHNTGEFVPSTWEGFDMINDGYIGGRLYVPAGRKLIIDYDCYSQLFVQGASASLTMEFDIRVSNLRSYEAEKEPVLEITSGSMSDGNPVGWVMLPLRSYLLTQSKRNVNTQDIQLSEDTRTHVAVNVVNNLSNKGRNYARVFVNSTMNREFQYSNDSFAIGPGSKIVIGSTSADIEVFGISVFKQALSSQNIQQNYKSALPTAAEKLAYQVRNDILGDDNTIDFTKCQQRGYSTMRWIADSPSTSKNTVASYRNKGNNLSKGTIEIIVRDKNGDVIPKYCQRITHCKQKGQGTSSMTYWEWNLTITATADSQRFVMNAEGEWILDESVGGEDCYLIWPNGKSGRADIKAVKNVAKRNWASSMQSHKMGWCNLYTDLYWACIGNSAANNVEKFENVRKSVTQLPFMFFVENEQGCKFSSFMTFGPAKFDKLCFGTKVPSPHYIKDGKPSSIFTVLEGSANGRRLPERKMPWIKSEVHYYLNRSNGDDPLNECLVYAGEAQLDVDKAPMNVFNEGQDDEYEIPKGFTPVPGSANEWEETEDTEFDTTDIYKVTKGNTIKMYRRAFNFDYLHSHRIKFISGTPSQLKARTDLDKDSLYWCTKAEGNNLAYDLFRYNQLTDSWVNAGVELDDGMEDGYSRLNLLEQCGSWLAAYNIQYNLNDPVAMNDAFIKARVQDYYNRSTIYYNEQDCDFDQAFKKFGALKDNWCKNTYVELEPDGLLTEDSDDNDTSGDLDNVGASKCPYFAEEHDRCDGDGNFDPNGANTYWNSDTNVRYCLREIARGNEICAMLQSMMNAMAEMAGSVMGCIEKYFFDDAQRYFPPVAYNEVSRLLYEEAAVAMAAGEYTNAIDPLSQNLGDHLQSELEFWKKRIAYLGSWCRSNEFANKAGTGSFSFRSGKGGAKYKFTIKAHQAVYPAVMIDGTLAGITKQRVLAGETYELDTVSVGTQDITCFLCGVDYYTSIGDLSGMSINSQVLNVSGKRLTEFTANGVDGEFRPGAISYSAPRLQKVNVQNVPTVTNAPDFSSCLCLEDVELKGCDGIGSVILPQTVTLKHVSLPGRLNTVTVINLESIETFELESAEYLYSIVIEQSSDVVAHSIYSMFAEII